MKPAIKANFTAMIFFAASLFYYSYTYSQKKALLQFDSTLESNSEKWKVKLHKFTNIGKPEFGPYTTLEIMPVEKEKSYRMLITNTADTVELVFSVSHFWHGRNSTLSDRLLSSNFSLFGTKGDITLAHGSKILGTVVTAHDSASSRFFMEDSVSYFKVPSRRFLHWHLVTVNDSIYTEPFHTRYGKPGSIYYYNWWDGVYVINATGVRIAALTFGDPFYIWIRKDIDPGQQFEIASLLGLMSLVRSGSFR